jgi:hypothetical protein
VVDLEAGLKINKQIIMGLIDSMDNGNYKDSFQMFQNEIHQLMKLCEKLS